jgi:hypothetical protein
VKWLVCREICIPGKAQLCLAWPARETPAQRAAHRALFAHAAARAPRPLPASWRATPPPAATTSCSRCIWASQWRPPSSFPLDPEQIENSAPQKASASSQGIGITLQKSEHLLHPISELNGVVVFPSGRAYIIHAEIK